MLEEYQIDRLTAFLDPERHVQRRRVYNVDQSQQAIANGGLSGQGLFEGPQTQLGFVPEQQTDFIFTAVGEELGFVGAAALLGLFAVVMLADLAHRPARPRPLRHAASASGVLAMFVFQVFENVGHDHGHHAGHRHPPARS